MSNDRVHDPWRILIRKRLTLEDCEVLLRYKDRYRTASWIWIDLIFVRLYSEAQSRADTLAVGRFEKRLYGIEDPARPLR